MIILKIEKKIENHFWKHCKYMEYACKNSCSRKMGLKTLYFKYCYNVLIKGVVLNY